MQHKAGRQNWHAAHKVKAPARWVRAWIPHFRKLAKALEADGVAVVNASEETALDCFPRQAIAEILPAPGEVLAAALQRCAKCGAEKQMANEGLCYPCQAAAHAGV
jgi:hypothetical protein